MKRSLLSLLILFVVILVALWIVGGRPMESYAQMEVVASPSKVFQHLTEPEAMKKWMQGLVSVETIDGSRTTASSAARIVLEVDGQQREMTEEILRVKKDELLEIVWRCPQFDIASTFEITFVDSGVDVRQTMNTTHKGVSRLFSPFSNGASQERLDADFARLKQIVEE